MEHDEGLAETKPPAAAVGVDFRLQFAAVRGCFWAILAQNMPVARIASSPRLRALPT